MRRFALHDIPGVGPVFADRLARLGLRTVDDALGYDRAALRGLFGARTGTWLYERTRGLDVRPTMQEELLYLSAEPRRVREPMTIQKLASAPLILYDARWGADDPMRRQLRERAQRAGVKIELDIEVEYMTAALDLAGRGLGDTIADRAIVASRGLARRLKGVPFDPPLYETFAFITRRNAHLTPATRQFIAVAEKRVAALGRRLEAERDEGAENGNGAG